MPPVIVLIIALKGFVYSGYIDLTLNGLFFCSQLYQYIATSDYVAPDIILFNI